MKNIVLITGVCGGIGSATARLFRNEGWQVIGIDRTENKDVEQYTDVFIKSDISETKNIDHIFSCIKEAGISYLNALVNLAAVQVAKNIVDTTEDEWDYVFNSNIKSVFNSVKKSHPLLKEGKGVIVNISSVHAYATSRGISAYAASKGALLAYTRSLALEFITDGIRVNCIIPGAINTNMLVDGLVRGSEGFETTQVLLDNLGLRHPINRVGEPEEVASLIHFLSDNTKSSFITGQSFIIDGGALAQLSTEVY